MPVASASKATSTATTKVKIARSSNKSFFASTQSRFASSKLIQNLGSGTNGVQFNFTGSLRTAHGRD